MTEQAKSELVDRHWQRESATGIADPVVETVPYVECKLEHSDLEPTRYEESFFPSAVPYEIDGTSRVFYWQSVAETDTEPTDWQGVCATTSQLCPLGSRSRSVTDALIYRTEDTTEITVDGTVAGDTTSAVVESYSVPTVRVRELSPSGLSLLVDDEMYHCDPGTRRRVTLSDRGVELPEEGDTMSVTPELAVRFPGEREIHHPRPGASYRLFPSFGLDLETVPNPVPVPTRNEELDHVSLADRLGVDLSARPYPERVLWQAFAYTVFDPHTDETARLAQLPSGHIVCV